MATAATAYKNDISQLPGTISNYSQKLSSYAFNSLDFLPSSPYLRAYGFKAASKPKSKSSTGATVGKGQFSHQLRTRICFVTLINAVLSWTVTAVGYFVMISGKAEGAGRSSDSVTKSFIISCSLLQVLLIVLYWRLKQRYHRSTHSPHLLTTSLVPAAPMQSPFPAYHCVCECIFHLIVFTPKFSVQFSVDVSDYQLQYSVNEVIFLAVTARNYHTVEAIYWWSMLADPRTHFISRLVGVKMTKTYLYRCFMAVYTQRIIFAVISFIVFLPGVLEYLFANINAIAKYYTIWSEYWIISMTQAPVGYGDNMPTDLFSEISLLVSCFSGLILLGLTTSISTNNLNLSLKECNLYSELLYTRGKQQHIPLAATLLQRWWRLMHMRKTRIRVPHTITAFYSYLPKYRKVIIQCQRLRDHRFERQVEAFEEFTMAAFRPLKEYLMPLRDAHEKAQDLIRAQYRVTNTVVQLYYKVPKSANLKGYLRKETEKISPKGQRRRQIAKGTMSQSAAKHGRGGQGLAIAKNVAIRNVKSRLLQTVRITSDLSDLENFGIEKQQ